MAMTSPPLTYDRLFIGGAWVPPSTEATIEVISPHSTEVVGRVPAAAAADVDRAVAVARRAFDEGDWPRVDPAERVAVLARLAALYEPRMMQMAELVTTEMGSPISFSRLAQGPAAWMLLNAFVQLAGAISWEEERAGLLGGSVIVRREPVGVVAAVAPWNAPQVTILSKLAPALVAGCTVLVKPAPETPLDALLLAELLAEAGVPEGVVSVLPADRDVSEYLVGHPGVDKVAFTGSTAVGRRIGAICADQLKRVSLELGGKSAAIVLDDADLAATAQTLRFASFANSGQVCVAQTRILAPHARYDEVVDAVAAMADGLTLGDPHDPDTDIGPLVTERQQARVEKYIALGQEEGARVVVGGNGMPPGLDRGWYVQPTVFADVDNDMRIAREEIFGPVLTVIPYDGEDDAVRIANDSPYGLAGSVFTTDVDRGLDVARRVRTGTFGVNQYTFDFAAPFGGYKQSGIGREYGPEGFDGYLEHKSIVPPGAGIDVG
jgi:aldehyde dehydrogenase (NAD+)